MSRSGTREICLPCGFCCRGLLYATVALEAREVSMARRAGLAVYEGDGEASFSQPCAAHGDAGCSVYVERPQACRSYRCALLAGVESGAVTFEKAMSLIERARALIAGIAVRLPPGTLSRTSLFDAARTVQPAEPELILDVASLIRILEQHFDGTVAKSSTRLRSR